MERTNVKLVTWVIQNDSWQFWYVRSRETLCAFWQANVSTKCIGYPIYAEFANPIHQTFWFEFLGDFRLQPRRCRTWRHWSWTAGRRSSSQGYSLSNFFSPNLRKSGKYLKSIWQKKFNKQSNWNWRPTAGRRSFSQGFSLQFFSPDLRQMKIWKICYNYLAKEI